MNPTGFPKEVYLENYTDILTNPQIYQSFGNTLFITVCSVLAIVVIGEMAAYPIAFRKSKLNDAFMVYLMIGFLVPFQAILLSLFEVMQTLHLIDSRIGMILFLLQWLGAYRVPFRGLYEDDPAGTPGGGDRGWLQHPKGVL